MNYAFNRIKFNKQVVRCLAKEYKKRHSIINNNNKAIIVRSYSSHQQDPQKNPFPSWQVITILSVLGLYHQYKNEIKRF